EERRKSLEKYLKKIGLKAKVIEINNIYGPAIQDKGIEAILLTEETFSNGRKINRKRKKNNLKELHYIVLPYLLDKTGKKFSNREK
ncbi:MAG: phosphopantetheine adenylyltransferase, partial [Candidatus Nealsonbacteria bacterium CG23_combo_of_CG06-09_8_20_14_all_39_25]